MGIKAVSVTNRFMTSERLKDQIDSGWLVTWQSEENGQN